MKTNLLLASVGLLVLGTAGCVSQGKYDAAVAQTETTRAELDRKSAELARTSAALAQANAQAASRAKNVAELEKTLDEISKSKDTEIADRQRRLGELAALLERAKAASSAADSRARLFQDIARRLEKQIAAGDLAVVVRDGRMVLQLPNDVLFDSGRTEIKPAGKESLKAVALVLATLPSRHFQVAGHTDNVPIHNERFPSNWELSQARALGVVRLLIEHGVKPAALSAAGYADVDPVASNDDGTGKRRNRRTEITVQPNIDELVAVP